MKTLYLMRHGETMFNVQHRIQGWCDSPLTEKGKQQALLARQWFQDHGITFDHAYSSTSERCCDTLELITEMEYRRTKGLKETFYGALEGQPDYLAEKDPKKCETYYLQFGGESTNTTRDRMVQTLTAIMEQEDHHSVIAMSHGAACFNFLRANVEDYSHQLKLGMGNCCIFIYEYENEKFTLKDVIRPGNI